MLNCKHVLGQATTDVEAILSTVNTAFSALDLNQLMQKPAPEKWSINECIDHLNITNAIYLPQMENTVAKGNKTGEILKATYQPGWLGKKAITSTKPNTDGSIPRPMKTFKKLDPKSQPQNKNSAINTFIKDQEKLLNIITKAENIDIGKNRITSAIWFVRFKFGDALQFLIAHQQRHILQAQNTLKLIES